jgi:hypothetical protein
MTTSTVGTGWEEGKKKPPTKAGGFCKLAKLSAATAGSATTPATTATTYRNPGRDGETRTHAAVDEINLDITAVFHQFVVNQESQFTFLDLHIVFFWLIQSQAQRGASSAALHQGYPQSRIDIILLQIGLQVCKSLFGNFQHTHILHVMD